MEAQSQEAIIQRAKDAPFQTLQVSPVGFCSKKDYEKGIREVLKKNSNSTTFEQLDSALNAKFHAPGRYADLLECYKASEEWPPLTTDHSGNESRWPITVNDSFVRLGDLVIRCRVEDDCYQE